MIPPTRAVGTTVGRIETSTTLGASKLNDNQYMRFFDNFGVKDPAKSNSSGSQYQGDCPFPSCKHSNKFFMNPSSGLWDCKVCQRSGNVYEFMRLLHDDCLTLTTDEMLDRLITTGTEPTMKPRSGISVEGLKHFGVVFNPVILEWMFPGYGQQKRTINNLYVYRGIFDPVKGTNYEVRAAPGLKQCTLGIEHADVKADIPWVILEGHFDTYAFWSALRKLKAPGATEPLSSTMNIVGIPGAGTIPHGLVNFLDGKHVTIPFDNDSAGRTGVTRFLNKLSDEGINPASVSTIEWPASSADGFDVRDLINECGKAGAFYSKFNKLKRLKETVAKVEISSGYDPTISPVACETLEELCDTYVKDGTHISQDFEDCIWFMTSVISAVAFGDIGIWAKVVGPPSSGKTHAANMFTAATPHTISLTTLTGLISGMQRRSGDLSLINRLQNKCLMFPEFTAMWSEAPLQRNQVMNDLRAAFDGNLSKSFKNDSEAKSYGSINFGIIACGTPEILVESDSKNGERFTIYQMCTRWSDDGHMTKNDLGDAESVSSAVRSMFASFMGSTGEAKDNYKTSKCKSWGFLDHTKTLARDKSVLRELAMAVSSDKEFEVLTHNLAKWTALCRATLARRRDEQLIIRPQIEHSTRMTKVLNKLAMTLMLVKGYKELNDDVVRMIRKVAFDSGNGIQQEVLHAIAHAGKVMSIDETGRAAQLQRSSVVRHLNDLLELGAVENVSRSPVSQNATGTTRIPVGRPTSVFYTLSPEMESVARAIGIYKEHK